MSCWKAWQVRKVVSSFDACVGDSSDDESDSVSDSLESLSESISSSMGAKGWVSAMV